MSDEEIVEDEPQQQIATDDQQDNGHEEESLEYWKNLALINKGIVDRHKAKEKLSKNIIPKQEPKIDEDIVKDVTYLKQVESKRQFGFEHNLSPEETDYAFKFSSGNPTKEILEDSFFKGGLESLRTKKRLEANIPGSSSRSSVFSEKSFNESSEDERKKAFESKVKSIRR